MSNQAAVDALALAERDAPAEADTDPDTLALTLSVALALASTSLVIVAVGFPEFAKLFTLLICPQTLFNPSFVGCFVGFLPPRARAAANRPFPMGLTAGLRVEPVDFWGRERLMCIFCLVSQGFLCLGLPAGFLEGFLLSMVDAAGADAEEAEADAETEGAAVMDDAGAPHPAGRDADADAEPEGLGALPEGA